MRLITAGLAILISHGLIFGLVERVIDGDTIVVDLGDRTETVRYIGVDTPETASEQGGGTVWNGSIRIQSITC